KSPDPIDEDIFEILIGTITEPIIRHQLSAFPWLQTGCPGASADSLHYAPLHPITCAIAPGLRCAPDPFGSGHGCTRYHWYSHRCRCAFSPNHSAAQSRYWFYVLRTWTCPPHQYSYFEHIVWNAGKPNHQRWQTQHEAVYRSSHG